MSGITESAVEEACLDYFRAIGYQTRHGPDLGPGGPAQERTDWGQVVLVGRLRDAIGRINPGLPPEAVSSVVATVLRAESQNAMAENLRVHTLLTRGVPVEYRTRDGATRHTLSWLVDFDHPAANDWLVVNQFSVIEDGHTRRPDVMVFLNGLPIALLELKNAGSEHATVRGAWNQIQTYRSTRKRAHHRVDAVRCDAHRVGHEDRANLRASCSRGLRSRSPECRMKAPLTEWTNRR